MLEPPVRWGRNLFDSGWRLKIECSLGKYFIRGEGLNGRNQHVTTILGQEVRPIRVVLLVDLGTEVRRPRKGLPEKVHEIIQSIGLP